MGQKYLQLSLEERCSIARLHEDGQSIRQIATTLARSPSTVARELKRNSSKTKGYQPSWAQVQTHGRRWKGSRLERQPELQALVLDRLAMGWSPQQVSGRLAQEKGYKVISHESIYRFIHAQIRRTKDYTWRHYLPYGKSKRGFRGRKGGSSALFMKARTSIHKRPSIVSQRTQAGHWEADLMLFSKYGQALLAVHERHSRLLMLFKQPTKEAKSVALQLQALFRSLPPKLAKTVTFDNGTEFSEPHQLHAMGIQTYFCDVRSPWQKGGIENAIGRFRRPLPRKTDLAVLSQEEINELVALYNHTPRKCIDFKTPAEIFYQKLLHWLCCINKVLRQGRKRY